MTPAESKALAKLLPPIGQAAEWKRLRDVIDGDESAAYSVVMTRIAHKGWVERRNRQDTAVRRSWFYRITPAGEHALSVYRLNAGHPNDTLGGRLVDYEREDERHLRHSFGYWRMVEKRMIREQLIAEGADATAPGFEFAVSARVDANHAKDPSAKQWQDMKRAAWTAAAPYLGHRVPTPSEEALAALRAIRDGHNDPRGLAASILDKLEASNVG